MYAPVFWFFEPFCAMKWSRYHCPFNFLQYRSRLSMRYLLFSGCMCCDGNGLLGCIKANAQNMGDVSNGHRGVSLVCSDLPHIATFPHFYILSALNNDGFSQTLCKQWWHIASETPAKCISIPVSWARRYIEFIFMFCIICAHAGSKCLFIWS